MELDFSEKDLQQIVSTVLIPLTTEIVKASSSTKPDSLPAEIISVSSDGLLANVQLLGADDSVLTDIQNKTGVILQVGEEVSLTAPFGDWSSAYITINKFGTSTDGRNIVADSISATSIVAHSITADQIQANSITAKEISTDFLSATNASIANLSATYATIEDLNVTNLTAQTLSANVAKVIDLTVGTLKVGSVTADSIKAGSIVAGSAIIANGAITNAMIGKEAVGTSQIADGSVTDLKVIDLSANSITSGTIDATKITVTNLNCANLTVGTINGTQIASGAITATNLAKAVNDLITGANATATTALTSANGKNKNYYGATAPTGTSNAGDLWFNTSKGNQVSQWSGTTWTLTQFGSLALSSLDAGSITTGTLNASIVTITNLSANSITGGSINAAIISVTNLKADNISSGTLSVDRLGAGTITGDKLVVDSITAREIASKCVTANEIFANTITAGEIKAGTITATEIHAGAITANEIKANTITVDQLASSVGSGLDISSNTSVTMRVSTVTYNAGISTANTNAQDYANSAQTNATSNATNLVNTLSKSGYLVQNPNLYWNPVNSYPDYFYGWGEGQTREVSLVRSGASSLRFNMTDGGQWGLNMASDLIGNQPALTYVFVEIDFMLVSGIISGSGILLDSNLGRTNIAIVNYIPSPTLNKWSSVRSVVALYGGSSTLQGAYLMANYGELGNGTKNIIFDRVVVREATKQEIDAYVQIPLKANQTTLDSQITILNNSINSKVSSTNYNGTNLVSMINQSASKISMSALNINLSGYATFTNLNTAGQTTINGGNITAGTLSASKISGGTLTLGGTTSGISTVLNAQNKELVRQDANGLTITLQVDPNTSLYGNAFRIQDPYGTTLLNVNGEGEFHFAGVISVTNGVSGGITNIYNGTITTSTLITTGAESKFSSGTTFQDPWQGHLCAFKASGDIGIYGSVIVRGEYRIWASDSAYYVAPKTDNSGGGIDYIRVTEGSSPTIFFRTKDAGQYAGTIWNSDITLKKNISTSTVNATDRLNQINLYSFDWICDNKYQSLGVISQDLYRVNPDWVIQLPEQNGHVMMQPNAGTLIPYLIKSNQELSEECRRLNSKILASESRISALESRASIV